MYQYKQTTKNRSVKAPIWIFEDKVVIDFKSDAVLAYPEMPSTCSSAMEGWELEAIARTNLAITMKDFIARMPVRDQPKPNALSMRRNRFRWHHGLSTWGSRGGTAPINDFMDAFHPEVCKAQNSIRFSRDLHPDEYDQLKEINKGKFPERKRKGSNFAKGDQSKRDGSVMKVESEASLSLLPGQSLSRNSKRQSTTSKSSLRQPQNESETEDDDFDEGLLPSKRLRRSGRLSLKPQQEPIEERMRKLNEDTEEVQDDMSSPGPDVPAEVGRKRRHAVSSSSETSDGDYIAFKPQPTVRRNDPKRILVEQLQHEQLSFSVGNDEQGIDNNDAEQYSRSPTPLDDSDCEEELPEDQRLLHHMPVSMDEQILLHNLLEPTRGEFVMHTREAPDPSDPTACYLSQWADMQTALYKRYLDMGRAELTPLLVGLVKVLGAELHWNRICAPVLSVDISDPLHDVSQSLEGGS